MPDLVSFNIASSLFPSGSQSAGTYNSADQQNIGRRGVKAIIDVTAATGTVTISIQVKDKISGKYLSLLTSAALGVGTTQLTVYPGITVTANVSASDVLPATWRISAVVAGGNVTATIGASLLV